MPLLPLGENCQGREYEALETKWGEDSVSVEKLPAMGQFLNKRDKKSFKEQGDKEPLKGENGMEEVQVAHSFTWEDRA
jgi:hypothetical protein